MNPDPPWSSWAPCQATLVDKHGGHTLILRIFPPKIDFFSTSNSDSPRNSLHKKLSLASVRDFLRKIEPNYVFASIFHAIEVEFGFSRVDFPPKGSKSKQIVVIYAKT